MGAVTYPDREVQEFLNEHFVCFKVNTKHTTAETRQLLRDYRLLWEPGFVVLDSRLTELRRMVGFLPPREFLAELQLALGKVDLLHLRLPDALERFQAVVRVAPASAVAPEALFWAGIADYRLTGRELETLERRWGELGERYPNSIWWTRADVLDHPPPESDDR